MKKIKIFILISMMGLGTIGLYAQGAKNNEIYKEIMSLGLKQAALIPSIMKNYVLIELKSNFRDVNAELRKDIDKFSQLQQKLEKIPADKSTKELISNHTSYWEKTKAFLKKTPSKENFTLLKYDHLGPLRESIRKMIRMSKKKADGPLCNCLFFSGKLSAVSQKFASLYMLEKWGTDSDKLKKEMRDMGESYAKILKKLKNNPHLSKEKFGSLLEKLEKDYTFFTLLEQNTATFVPSLVYRKTDIMREHSDKMMDLIYKNP